MVALPALETALIEAVVGRALGSGGDFAEVFVEDSVGLGMRLEDGKVEQTAGGHEHGAAVRLNSGERTYYAYTDEVDEAGLFEAAAAVAAALRSGAAGATSQLGAVHSEPGRHPVQVPPETVPIVRKRDLLHAADEVARGSSPLVGQVIAGYSEGRQRVLIANSLGDLVRDDRTRVRFVATVIARRDGIIQTGYQTIGGSAGFEILDEKVVTEAAAKAAGKAVTMLDARPAPMGAMPVVLANGFGGTLFHEACGHGLEADAIAKGASIYADRMGDVVAAPIINAYDDGSLANGWGSAAFDDEGVPTRKTMVIEEGRLCGYLYDRLRARACRRGVHRQRPAAVVPPRAPAAHDHDLHRAGRRHSRSDHRRHRPRLLRQEPGRRPGRAGQRQLRLRRVRGLSHREGQGHRRLCAALRWWATASTSSSRST